MSNNYELVFVYGTLKYGFHNHRFLVGLPFDVAFAPNIDLHAGPLFPFAKRGTNFACGELYKVDLHTLKKLDKLEGHPVFYKREKTTVIVKGEQKQAWIYLCDRAKSYPIIESGNWNPVTLKAIA